ncbi:hypothetical protein [Microbacterium radiodurans]|uniref:hypothetical protein n=1 Tax=Microbacterium radiodurans TaxID=661398 RepID=UPI00168AB8AB|nr:hypothetical protein [Microbacterium radiodurans]
MLQRDGHRRMTAMRAVLTPGLVGAPVAISTLDYPTFRASGARRPADSRRGAH